MEKRTAGIFESRKGRTAGQSTTASPARRRHQSPHLIAHRDKLPSSKTLPHNNHDVQRLRWRRTHPQALPNHPPHIVPRNGDPDPPGYRNPQPRPNPGLARSSRHNHEGPASPRRLLQNRPVLLRPSQGRPPLHEPPSLLVRYRQPLAPGRPPPLQYLTSRLRLHSLPKSMNLLAPQIGWLPISNRHRLPPPKRQSSPGKNCKFILFALARQEPIPLFPRIQPPKQTSSFLPRRFRTLQIRRCFSVFTSRLINSE